MSDTKDIYRNDSEGVCGVVVIDNGKPKGIPINPGDSIPLSEEERIATANAPRLEADNPFTNGTLVLETPAAEIKNRRTIDGPAAGPPPEPDPEPAPEPEPELTPEEQKAKADAAREAQAQKQAEQPGKPVDETGAAVEPQGLPHQGKRAPKEEVATPTAPAKAGTPKG